MVRRLGTVIAVYTPCFLNISRKQEVSMTKVDIHHYERRINAALRRIKTANHPKCNKKIIFEFYEYLVAEGLGKGRIAKYLYHLLKISGWMNKSFRRANRGDVIKLVQVIENQSYTAHTKHDYKIVIKRFFKWLRDSDKYPYEVDWIKTTIKETNSIIPEELLTEEEIKSLIDAAKHPRNKAMVAFLYESGCRVGELLSLQIRHVVFDVGNRKRILFPYVDLRCLTRSCHDCTAVCSQK